MREILFRGKRFSNGEWVIGGIMKTFHPNYDCENEEEFLSQSPNCYCICANNKDYFVEQASIGQYTGLTDKNGKKIFEGDIVSAPIYYDIGCYPHTESKIISVKIPEIYKMAFDGNFEIIGNIHDNPELLKGGVQE